MKKQWFDQRAVDGREWAVVSVEVTSYEFFRFALTLVKTTKYYAVQASDIHRRKLIGRNMLEKEAIALAKMLNAVKD